jgi:hypothetical protein
LKVIVAGNDLLVVTWKVSKYRSIYVGCVEVAHLLRDTNSAATSCTRFWSLWPLKELDYEFVQPFIICTVKCDLVIPCGRYDVGFLANYRTDKNIS